MPQSPEPHRSNRRLRIVIPACDEERRIEPTLRDFCTAFANDATVVVVANGCADGTAALVQRLRAEYANLELIDVPSRIGKGGAVRMGLTVGSEPRVGFVDADGSTAAAEFRRLVQVLEQRGVEAVIGSRWQAASRVSTPQPLARRFASRGFNTVVNLLFQLGVRDTQCGAKVFRRAALADVLPALELADYAFDIEVLWRLKRARHSVCEEPTVWADRNGSRIDLGRVPWIMLKSIVRLRLQESFLWRIPLVDRFGRNSVIPVRSQRRLLALNVPPEDPCVRRFVEALCARGVAVVSLSEELPPGGFFAARGDARCGWRAFLWYALASRRQYDGLVEFAGQPRSWISRYSSKPTFRLQIAALSGSTRLSERSEPGVTWLSLAGAQVEASARIVDTVTVRSLPYRGVLLEGTEFVTSGLKRTS